MRLVCLVGARARVRVRVTVRVRVRVKVGVRVGVGVAARVPVLAADVARHRLPRLRALARHVPHACLGVRLGSASALALKL